MTAVIIPVAIKAVTSFFDSLENFIGIIGYWSAAFCSILIVEHSVFRRQDWASYDPTHYNDARALTTGIPGLAAGIASFGLVVVSMAQIWFTGPIAEKTGDIGFEFAFVVSALLYVPFRFAEIKIRGRL